MGVTNNDSQLTYGTVCGRRDDWTQCDDGLKPAFHDADTDIVADIVARMSAYRSACHRDNSRKSRVSDVSARILARTSVSALASWNAGLTHRVGRVSVGTSRRTSPRCRRRVSAFMRRRSDVQPPTNDGSLCLISYSGPAMQQTDLTPTHPVLLISNL